MEQHDEGKRTRALRPVNRHRKEALLRSGAPLLGGPRLKGVGIAGLPGDEDGALPPTTRPLKAASSWSAPRKPTERHAEQVKPAAKRLQRVMFLPAPAADLRHVFTDQASL